MGIAMKYSVVKQVSILIISLLPVITFADNLAIPHSFSAGSTIKSAEMNENFSVVASRINQQSAQITSIDGALADIGANLESFHQSVDANGATLTDISSVLSVISSSLVSIDSKLTTTSPAAVSDQLLCRGQPRNLATETMQCLQASDTSSTRDLTMAQIFAEGWIAVSLGGPDDYYAGYIFHK